MIEQPEINVGKSVELSIVIIARNEARNIARAIESVLKAVKNWPKTEILLVDSASTDETVEIARCYPINIVRLPSSWFLSVAAGRYIGMEYTHGEMVLHMDGDMELDSEWVNRSVSFALDHPDVAAIGGYWHNIYMKNGQIVGEEDQMHHPEDCMEEVKYVGGASLYRRSAIYKAGGYQPFIRGEEDVILCIGLRNEGFKIIRLPFLMSLHHCIPPVSLSGSIRRFQLNMWLGYGQIPRYYLGTPLFRTYLIERGVFIIPLLGIVCLLITILLSLVFKNITFLGGCLLILAFVFIALIFKKHDFRKSLLSILTRMMISYSAVRGFLMKTRSPSEYPTDVEIIQVFDN